MFAEMQAFFSKFCCFKNSKTSERRLLPTGGRNWHQFTFIFERAQASAGWFVVFGSNSGNNFVLNRLQL
jgi:hypothetical protein